MGTDTEKEIDLALARAAQELSSSYEEQLLPGRALRKARLIEAALNQDNSRDSFSTAAFRRFSQRFSNQQMLAFSSIGICLLALVFNATQGSKDLELAAYSSTGGASISESVLSVGNLEINDDSQEGNLSRADLLSYLSIEDDSIEEPQTADNSSDLDIGVTEEALNGGDLLAYVSFEETDDEISATEELTTEELDEDDEYLYL